MIASWDRQPGESPPAFAAFKAYCEQVKRGERSIRDLGKQLGKSRQLLGRWSTVHHWQKRVRDKETFEADQLRAALDKAAAAKANEWATREQSLREREWSAAIKLIEKAEAMLGHPLSQDGKKGAKPARWNMGDAGRLLNVASKLMRLATGNATEKIEAAGPNNEPLAMGTVTLFLPDNGRKDGA